MSFALFSLRSFYSKSSLSCRYLSTLIQRRNSNKLLFNLAYRNSLHNPIENHQNIIRFTSHKPSSFKQQSTSSNDNNQLSFKFLPGKANEKPTLEHLRYIETQIKKLLPDFCRRMHPYALYTSDIIFENYYQDPPKVMKGAGSYALTLFWTRIKLNSMLLNLTIRVLETVVDEELGCVKVRWRISGASNQSLIGIVRGWRKPRDLATNIRNYVHHYYVLSTFYVRGDGRIYKHRIDRIKIDEEAATVKESLNKTN